MSIGQIPREKTINKIVLVRGDEKMTCYRWPGESTQGCLDLHVKHRGFVVDDMTPMEPVFSWSMSMWVGREVLA